MDTLFKSSVKWLVFCQLALGVATLISEQSNLFQKVQNKITDIYFSINEKSQVELQDTVSLVFDASSLREFGYPLPRSVYARLIESINPRKDETVAFDIIFGSNQMLKQHNQFLSKQISKLNNPVFAAHIDEQDQVETSDPQIIGNFSSNSEPLGLVDFVLDSDGVLRWYPLVTLVKDKYIPSLGFNVFLKIRGFEFEVDSVPSGDIKSIRLFKNKTLQKVLDLTSDPNRSGRIFLQPLAKSDNVKDLSFSQVISDGLFLRKSAYLIGARVSGISPIIPTSVDNQQAPIHIHQFAINSLLLGKDFKQSSRLYDIGLSIISSGLLIIFGQTILRVILTFVVLLFVFLATGYLCFNYFFLFVPIASMLTVFLFSLIIVIRLVLMGKKQNEILIKSFSAYLHPKLVLQLANKFEPARLGGERKLISIFFSDLRNFTSMSEELEPHVLGEFMNGYFDLVTKIIQDTDGTLDKYIGDAVMAFWNAPVEIDNHKEMAIVAALKIEDEFVKYLKHWEIRLGKKLDVNIGIGVHSGEAIVGNFGGHNRFNYTAIGDEVNLASRVEGLTKYYGVRFLATKSVGTYQEKNFIEIDTIRVKGRIQPITVGIFCALTKSDEDCWKRFLQEYKVGNFKLAKEALIKVQSQELPTSIFYERLLKLSNSQVSDWDGIWKFDHK